MSATIRVHRPIRVYSRHSAILIANVTSSSTEFQQFIVIHDNDVLPLYDPRVEMVVDVEPLAHAPFTLDGNERTQQIAAKNRKASEDGTALSYRAKLCTRWKMPAQEPVTLRCVASILPSGQRRKVYMGNKAIAASFTTLCTIDESLKLLSLTHVQRWAVLSMFADMHTSEEYMILATRGATTPSSLLRLSAVELLHVATYIGSLSLSEDKHAAVFASRFADLLPLSLIGTRRRLRQQLVIDREWQEQPQATELDLMANSMRSTQSTVATLSEPLDDRWVNLLPLVPTFVHIKDTTYANARDFHLENEASQLIHACKRIILMAAAGDVSLLSRIPARVRGSAIYVAPTATHAAVCPFDVLSVDDVLAGRYANRDISTLVFVFAHRFGLDSFVHIRRIFFQVETVIFIGDPYDSNGSPRESDRGCVMRDLAAAARRGYVPQCSLESLFGFESATSTLNALTQSEHAALRSTNPSLPENSSYSIVDTLEDVPSNAQAPLLVGVASVAAAATLTKTAGAFKNVGSHMAFDELGQIARVAAQFQIVSAINPVNTRVGSENHTPIKGDMPLDTLGGYVLLDTHDVLVDHRRCCHTASPNLVALGMHPTQRSVSSAPARLLARISPMAIADKLACIITEKTGIEDILAAFSLARSHVYFVGTQEVLLASLSRHGSRPRTQLVDLLQKNMPSVPMPLLQFPVLPSPQQTPDSVIAVLYLGAADTSDNTTMTLSDATRALDMFLGAGEIPMIEIEEEKEELPAFRGGKIDRFILATGRTVDEVDTLVKMRLGALAWANPLEGENNGEKEHNAWLNYDGGTVEEERALVHLFCVIVRHVAESWYIEAERQLMYDRCMRMGRADAMSVADRHAAAIRAHLPTVSPPPALIETDAFHLCTKLHGVREYVTKK